MYAIVEVSGRQEKVEKGSRFTVSNLDKQVGAKIKISHVLFAKKGNSYLIGDPYVKGASLECEVTSNYRAKKVIAFKYKRRKSYRRKIGHRQDLTVLEVKEMNL